LIQENIVTAVHDCSDGGLAVALAEMALASGIGCECNGVINMTPEQWWFGEDQSRYVVTISDQDKLDQFIGRYVDIEGLNHSDFNLLGTTKGFDVVLGGSMVPLTDLRAAHESFFKNWMEG
jgi:phosphoribosylformylglycinamidine synthase